MRQRLKERQNNGCCDGEMVFVFWSISSIQISLNNFGIVTAALWTLMVRLLVGWSVVGPFVGQMILCANLTNAVSERIISDRGVIGNLHFQKHIFEILFTVHCITCRQVNLQRSENWCYQWVNIHMVRMHIHTYSIYALLHFNLRHDIHSFRRCSYGQIVIVVLLYISASSISIIV